jgi:hypothetical protein
MKAPLTSKVKLLQGRVRQQDLGQILRSRVPIFFPARFKQVNDIRVNLPESCPILL